MAPLLVALTRDSRVFRGSRIPHPEPQALLLGLLTGIVYFSGTLYWITRVMAVYGGLPFWVAVLINAALIVYMALFPAIFAVIVRRFAISYGAAALAAAPFVWVATELGRTHLLTGFPWVLLGYSQVTVLPIAQLASVLGVYGISMLLVSVSAAMAAIAIEGPLGVSPDDHPRIRRTSWVRASMVTPGSVGLVAVLTLVFTVAVWGSRRAARSTWTREGQPVRVGLVQGNVDQAQKWEQASAVGIFQDYLRKTRQAIGEGAQLVVWPESSTPFMYEEDLLGAEQLRRLVRQARVPILFGSDQIEWRTIDKRRVPDKYFNSAFVLREDGSTAGVYRKMHLVPFGEYVPLQRLLFFAAPLTEQVGTFSPGLNPELLRVDVPGASASHALSVSICYEVVYPELVRRFVTAGSELLTTITNDAWFGATSAPYQHFEQASMRAIEEGRYLVRAANTGISGIVDPYGHVLLETRIFEPAVVLGEARFLRTTTFYMRHGNVVTYVSLIVTLALLVLSWRRVQ